MGEGVGLNGGELEIGSTTGIGTNASTTAVFRQMQW